MSSTESTKAVRFMRMAELSAQAGVPVATIKYYLREGLLPPGERTSPNQARYQPSHVRRLKLVRALLDIGGLSIAQAREVLAAVDSPTSIHQALGAAQRRLTPEHRQAQTPARERAAALLDGVAAHRGWHLKPGDPAAEAAVDALSTMIELGHEELLERLSEYAEQADRVAELDVTSVGALPDRDSTVEATVVGIVLGDALFAALRRLGQQRVSAGTFGGAAIPD